MDAKIMSVSNPTINEFVSESTDEKANLDKKVGTMLDNTYEAFNSKVALSTSVGKSKVADTTEKVVKRLVDIAAGLTGTVLLVPLTAVVYAINKASKEDDGPLFYTQERIGKNGKPFKMYKYRSMCVDADEKLQKFLNENESIREEFYIYRKIKNDPRVTKAGKFLRKTSLDEFPQFIHVLKGEMSLVGPRPYLPREKQDMGDYYKIITQYKPGITGLWQTEGRSDVTFNDRLDMDIEYHKNHSVKEDVKIVWKTVENVVKKKGAI